MPSFRLTKPGIAKVGKAAAAGFAAYFTYVLGAYVLAFPTEPMVVGGLYLNEPVPQAPPWSPLWPPILLAALFAYFMWPRKIPEGSVRRFIRGSLTLLLIELFALFVSILCPHAGSVYLLLPMLTGGEIPSVLLQLVLSSAAAVVISLVFYGVGLLASSIVIGPLILSATRFMSSRLTTVTLGGWCTNPTDIARGLFAFDVARLTRNLPRILAILISGAIIAAGFKFAGIYLFVFWLMHFFSSALPCFIVLGVAIGWLGKDWTWCVAVSLPIGWVFSIDRNLPGILTSQMFDFPVVLFATLIGFWLARKIRSRQAVQSAVVSRV